MRALLLPLAVIAASGCATTPAPVPDPAMVALNNAVAEIQAGWAELGAIKRAQVPDHAKLVASSEVPTTEALVQKVTLRAEGDIEDVLTTVAKAAGMPPPAIIGIRPPTIVPVFLEADQMEVREVIRQVGYQAGDRVTVRLIADAGAEAIEISYAPIN